MYILGPLSRFGHFIDQKTWAFYPACNGCNDELDRTAGLSAMRLTAPTHRAVAALPPMSANSCQRLSPRLSIQTRESCHEAGRVLNAKTTPLPNNTPTMDFWIRHLP